MSAIHNDTKAVAKKRKHEEDAASAPKRSKKSKSDRSQDRNPKETANHTTPIPQERPSDAVALSERKRQRKRKEGADKMGEQPDQPIPHIEPRSSDRVLSKKERKRQKKEAKKLAIQSQDLHSRKDDGNTASRNGIDDGQREAAMQSVGGDKAERKAAKRLRKGSSDTYSKQVLENDQTSNMVDSISVKPSFPGWTLSSPSAGRFLDQDPIFVENEDGEGFLITANNREMQLLSLETSLITNTLQAPPGLHIVSHALDNLLSNRIRIAYDDGTVYSCDWTDGSVQKESRTSGTVKAMAAARLTEENESMFIYISRLGRETVIFGRDQSLYVTKQHLQAIQVLGDTEYVVAQGPSVVVLGMKKQGNVDLIWIELPLMTKCTCFDARLLPLLSGTKKHTKQRPGLCLAIGNEDGQIHLFDDVSSIFGQPGQQKLPRPRILHWHREAVSTVKFGRDGNYLISGGKETVLVLWQLETGKKQFLPHLTSEIERIVVSPKGDRYTLQMGDNSVMVLSTSELKPVANFAGLQMASRAESVARDTLPAPAATLHPIHPHQLLLTVPSTRPKSSKHISTRPFLQSFDIRTSRHITRQALSRNNITDFNLGPERTPIIPPDVKHLSISQDGSWLATIDEWMPPVSDLGHLMHGGSGTDLQREQRREVYLKFWSWDDVQALWTLTTRVDSPHAPSEGNSSGGGRVLALVADPASNGFATIGEDSCVKMWVPRTRKRHGVTLRDKANVGLVEWSCKKVVQLVGDKERADSPMDFTESAASFKACLSYSADGSMLAAAQSTLDPAESPVVHFMDTSTGEVIRKSGLATAQILTIGFIDRYFIALSRPAAYVWDLVNDTLMYKIKLFSSNATASHKEPMMTVNDRDGTYALVMHDGEKGRASIEVYGAREPRCLYKQNLHTQPEAVLASKGTSGYTLLFGDATIRTLLPPATAAPTRLHQSHEQLTADSAAPPVEVETLVESSARAVDVEIKDFNPVEKDQTHDFMLADDEDDRPVVRPEQLANIFDSTQSFAMAPVKDMFQAVVGLFGQQPYIKPQVEVL